MSSDEPTPAEVERIVAAVEQDRIDEEQRFLDAAAIAAMQSSIEQPLPPLMRGNLTSEIENIARGSFVVANILLAERRKNLVK